MKYLFSSLSLIGASRPSGLTVLAEFVTPWSHCLNLPREGEEGKRLEPDGSLLLQCQRLDATQPNCNLRTIPVVQVELPRQLSGSGISIITAVAARLLVGKELYRHQVISFRPPHPKGGASKKQNDLQF